MIHGVRLSNFYTGQEISPHAQGEALVVECWLLMSSFAFVTEHFNSHWIFASPRVPVEQQKLMIVLHGRGDSLHSFLDISAELRLPQMNYLLLNAPRRFAGGYSWYGQEPRHEPGIRKARARLFALIDELLDAGWDARDLYFLGHSQGALMVCDLLMHHPATFGGVVGVSGYVHFPRGWKIRSRRSAASRTPWLMTYGTRDRVIPAAEIREDLEQLWQVGLPVVAQAFKKGHDFDFHEEVPFMRRWLRRHL